MTVAISHGLAPKVRPQRPTLLWCYALLAPAMVFMLTSLDRNYQTDLWHHLARGREMCQTGTLLNRDVFTFTAADQPIVDNNWLTQVVAYKLYAWGGINLLQALNSILLSLTVGGVMWIGLRRGTSVRVAGIIGVVVVMGLSSTLLIRPQTVSMLLFVLLLAILREAERRPQLLWLAPAVLAVWANVHGAFPIGLVLIGCFVLASCIDALRRDPHSERPKPLTMIGCFTASAIATLVNPYGAGVFDYVRVTSSRASSRVIQEWLRPDAFTLAGAFWVVSIGLMIALAVVRRRYVRSWAAVIAVVFAAISFTSVRMGIWWYLAAATIAMSLWPRQSRSTSTPSLPAAALYAMIVIAMVISLPGLERWNPIFAVRSTERPEQHLADLAGTITADAPGSRVFSRLEWGEYLSFALPWKNSIFMDGRIEIYSDRQWEEYRHITSASADWQSLLDHYGVTVLLLDRQYHDGLIQAASNSPRWKEHAAIDTGIIFLRVD